MSKKHNNGHIKQWFEDRYGSRRGFVTAYMCRLRYLLGNYKKYQQVEWGSVQRLVFVCTGNICRSAYAEAIGRSLNIDCVSCGLDTYDGDPANPQAIQVAGSEGIDLTKHRTTSIKSLKIKDGDLFIAMEPEQIELLESILGTGSNRTLLGLWNSPSNPNIQDPFGKSVAYFQTCFNDIKRFVSEIVKIIDKKSSRYID